MLPFFNGGRMINIFLALFYFQTVTMLLCLKIPLAKNLETEDQQHAFDKTQSGGIKATQLAGALFNHKDDKKGHHDVFCFQWSQNIGGEVTFPDTSNIRFQSHCEAAAILVYLENFISFFLNMLKQRKIPISSII